MSPKSQLCYKDMKPAVEVKDIPCLRLLHLSSIIVDAQQGSKWTNAIRLSKMSCYTGLSADDLTQQDNSQVAAQPWVCSFVPLALGQLYERGFWRFHRFCFKKSPLAMSKQKKLKHNSIPFFNSCKYSVCTSSGSNPAFLVSDSYPDPEKCIDPSRQCLQEIVVLVLTVQKEGEDYSKI